MINGDIITDGPLADIYSGGDVAVKGQKAILTGRVTARSLTGKSVAGAKFSKLIAFSRVCLAKSETEGGDSAIAEDAFTGYSLNDDGTITAYTENVPSGTIVVADTPFTFEDGVWCVRGDGAVVVESIRVAGDLRIDVAAAVFEGTVTTGGSFTATGAVTIDAGDPFVKALAVSGTTHVNDISVVGKIESVGDIVIDGYADIIGTLITEGSITVNGNARINYLDTIYKAALGDAQSEFSETLLSHSQVFRDLWGKNSMALFTFMKGYRLTRERDILAAIRDGSINRDDFYSRLIGSTLDYGAAMGGETGLSVYYLNKAYVLDYLANQGHSAVTIIESLHVEPDNLFHTFADRDGTVIGTFQLYGSGVSYADGAEPVVLGTDAREALKTELAARKADAAAATPVAANVVADRDGGYLVNGKKICKSDMTRLGMRAEDLTKTADELRLEEWMRYKDMHEELEEVEIEILSNEPVASVGNVKGATRFSLKKKIRKAVKKVTNAVKDAAGAAGNFIYHTEWDKGFISGVDESKNDIWTNEVSLHNSTSNCGPISAGMILIWHDRMFNRSATRNLVAERGRTRSPAWWDPKKHISWISAYCKTGLWDKTNFAIPGYIEGMIHAVNMNGRASWDWTYDVFGPVREIEMYFDLVAGVNGNQPDIVGLFPTNGVAGYLGNGLINGEWKLSGHYMPVIGYKIKKRKVFNLDTVIFDERYIYTDTTWYGEKRYWRFDWFASGLTYNSSIEIDVR